MSGVPLFAVFYDLASMKMTREVHIDISNSDSEDNVRRGLAAHRMPTEGIIFVAKHQAEQLPNILAELGIVLTA
jgi:hypothetical protein